MTLQLAFLEVSLVLESIEWQIVLACPVSPALEEFSFVLAWELATKGGRNDQLTFAARQVMGKLAGVDSPGREVVLGFASNVAFHHVAFETVAVL